MTAAQRNKRDAKKLRELLHVLFAKNINIYTYEHDGQRIRIERLRGSEQCFEITEIKE